MRPRLGPWLAALGVAVLWACAGDDTSNQPTGLDALTGPGARGLAAGVIAVDRPFGGRCTITLLPRVHDDSGGCGGGGDDGGGCSGGEEGGCGEDEGSGEEGGGPPIGRHFELAGVCNLTHLGLAQVTGRLNLSGPFGADGHAGAGNGALGARGRLVFVAANGDQLVGRYIPVHAVFTRDSADGGTVAFTSTEQFGLRCSDPGGGPGGEEEEEEADTSTGRFTGATGSATLSGRVRILRSSGGGTGTFTFGDGRLTY
jgi:hypothetical protein